MTYKMTCSCPKCNTPTEFAPVNIPSESSFNSCAACGAKFLIRKESFAKRALYKGDAIYCAECGEHPGSAIYCQNCHAIYPDFLVTESTSAAKRRIEKFIASFTALKKLKVGGAAKSVHSSIDSTPAKPGKTKGLKLPGQPKILAAVLAALVIFSAGAGYYWYQNKIETAYSENYIRALLGIKTARDLEMRISNRLINDMKIGAAATLTAAEQKSTTTAKNSVDNLIKSVGKVPKKFGNSDAALRKLNESYGKIHVTVTSPTGTSDIFAAAIKKTDEEFMKNAGELKSGLPEKISVIFTASRKKYKPLQDL